MMSNSEARKRQYDADAIAVASANAEQRFIAHDEARAAGELVADVDTLTGFIRNHPALPPRELAEALVAAGFGRIDAARREQRERIARAIEADTDDFCGGCDSCDGNTRFGLTLAAEIARKATS